jgi:hypothetical protein
MARKSQNLEATQSPFSASGSSAIRVESRGSPATSTYKWKSSKVLGERMEMDEN